MIHVSSDIPRFDDAKTDRPIHPSTPHAKDRYVGLITKTASNKKQTRILHKSFALGQNVRMARNGSEIYPGSPTTLFSPPALEYFANANLGLDSEKMFNVYI